MASRAPRTVHCSAYAHHSHKSNDRTLPHGKHGRTDMPCKLPCWGLSEPEPPPTHKTAEPGRPNSAPYYTSNVDGAEVGAENVQKMSPIKYKEMSQSTSTVQKTYETFRTCILVTENATNNSNDERKTTSSQKNSRKNFPPSRHERRSKCNKNVTRM